MTLTRQQTEALFRAMECVQSYSLSEGPFGVVRATPAPDDAYRSGIAYLAITPQGVTAMHLRDGRRRTLTLATLRDPESC